MKLIKLTQGKFTKVDDNHYKRLNKYKWCLLQGPRTAYAVSFIEGKQIKMHRYLMKPSKGLVTDHIDGDGLNNQISNLRVCTIAQNRYNSHCTRKSGRTSRFKGVSYVKRERVWRAFIYLNRKQIYLGRFKTEIDAAKAYDSKALVLFGEFARLNLP